MPNGFTVSQKSLPSDDGVDEEQATQPVEEEEGFEITVAAQTATMPQGDGDSGAAGLSYEYAMCLFSSDDATGDLSLAHDAGVPQGFLDELAITSSCSADPAMSSAENVQVGPFAQAPSPASVPLPSLLLQDADEDSIEHIVRAMSSELQRLLARLAEILLSMGSSRMATAAQLGHLLPDDLRAWMRGSSVRLVAILRLFPDDFAIHHIGRGLYVQYLHPVVQATYTPVLRRRSDRLDLPFQ
eukprot:TRINITY_DN19061_c0_g1_i1.p1 TRINITY_DN19061_c0_g1~~TRINITY_DN19061_c0_g1_i1.p1  ORF type:complete len:242 (-),score=33.18 TRINITY_DN19061_c0_g1_i1:282-1007(-)